MRVPRPCCQNPSPLRPQRGHAHQSSVGVDVPSTRPVAHATYLANQCPLHVGTANVFAACRQQRATAWLHGHGAALCMDGSSCGSRAKPRTLMAGCEARAVSGPAAALPVKRSSCGSMLRDSALVPPRRPIILLHSNCVCCMAAMSDCTGGFEYDMRCVFDRISDTHHISDHAAR